jgi:[acyl-carrier-protein] S-malonyltransferase
VKEHVHDQNRRRRVAVIFPGQGAQHPGMGVGLYGKDPFFTATMDDFFTASGDFGDQLRTEWLTAAPDPMFDDVSRAQPLLYALGCALGKTLLGHGVVPDAMVGHSVGELCAATVADVFKVTDGATLMMDRTKAVAKTVPGGMLAVAATPRRVQPYLTPTVVIGAYNTPRQVVLSGPAQELAAIERKLLVDGFACQPTKARQAFHSPACDEPAAESEELFRGFGLREPSISIYSTYTGSTVSPGEAVTPAFWAVQMARPVLFWRALDNMLSSADYLLLEAGPRGSCSAMVRRHPAIRAGRSVLLPMIAAPGFNSTDDAHILTEAIDAALSSPDPQVFD